MSLKKTIIILCVFSWVFIFRAHPVTGASSTLANDNGTVLIPVPDTTAQATINFTLKVSIPFLTFVLTRATVTYTGLPQKKLPLQFRLLGPGKHTFLWTDLVPETAAGKAGVTVYVIHIPGRRSVLNQQFTVTGTSPAENSYVGSYRCMGCHAGFTMDIVSAYTQSGHFFALNAVSGQAPEYPSFTPGVPDPPAGNEWSAVSHVAGGYAWYADFIHAENGTAITGPGSQYNFANAALGTLSEFVSFTPDSSQRACSACHATGDTSAGSTVKENGVGCEACHGPASRHASAPSTYTPPDDPALACSACHARDNETVFASAGLIINKQQARELAASPKNFMHCSACHDAHASAHYDAQASGAGIVQQCTACHPGVRVGLSMQSLSCTDCHMPYAVQAAAAATYPDAEGKPVKRGDMRSHILKINTVAGAPGAMFADNGTTLALDSEGRSAGLTLDFVCQHCHRPGGEAANSYTYGQLKAFAPAVHAQ